MDSEIFGYFFELFKIERGVKIFQYRGKSLPAEVTHVERSGVGASRNGIESNNVLFGHSERR